VPLFRYLLLNEQGQPQAGVVSLPFEEPGQAVRRLERQGGVVLDLSRLGWLATRLAQARAALRSVRSGSANQATEALSGLAALLAAGVPVLTALEDLSAEVAAPALAEALRFIRLDVENGRPLSEALAGYPTLFPPLVADMCRIGEETGRLDQMLRKAAEHLERMAQIRGAAQRALLYPAFLAATVAAAALFWLVAVVPQLVQLFKDMDIPLPFLTRALLRVSETVLSSWPLGLGMLLTLVALFFLARSGSARFRRRCDALWLRLPLAGKALQTALHARLCEHFGLLAGAGLGVARSLELVAQTVGNADYRRRLIEAREGVVNGLPLSEALRRSQAVQPLATRLIAVGESTGRIDEQLLYAARLYRERLNAMAETMGKTLEPILLLVLGAIFCLLVAGLLLPLYDALGKLQG
jgi:type II secretory pathway component PulF